MAPLYIALILIPCGVVLLAASFLTGKKLPSIEEVPDVTTYRSYVPVTSYVEPSPTVVLDVLPSVMKSPIPQLDDVQYSALIRVNDYASKRAVAHSYDHATSEDVQTLRDRITERRFGSVVDLSKAVDIIEDVTVTSALHNIDLARLRMDYSLRTPEDIAAVAMANREAMRPRD